MRSTDRDALVHDVCAVVDGFQDELVESLAEAIRIPSVTPTYPGVDYAEHIGEEACVSRLIERLLASAGAETELFGEVAGRENCAGVMRGSGGGRSLILNGHVDVVPGGAPEEWRHGDAFSGGVEDGRVWGRGACDMKGGLLAQVFAAIALRRSGLALAGDLTVEAVVGEECMEHELGTSACVARGYRADAAVVAEPSAPPVPLAVVAITPGVTRFIVTIEGRRTHPAMRGMTIHPGADAFSIGVNAVDKAFLIYQALRQREEEWGLTKRHPLFAPGQFVIHPGVVVASPRGQLDPFFIADHATLDYIVIHHPDEAIEDVRSEIEDVVATVAHLDGWLRDHPPAIEWKHHWPPSCVAPDHPIVAAACRAIRKVTLTGSVPLGPPHPAALRRRHQGCHDGTRRACPGDRVRRRRPRPHSRGIGKSEVPQRRAGLRIAEPLLRARVRERGGATRLESCSEASSRDS